MKRTTFVQAVIIGMFICLWNTGYALDWTYFGNYSGDVDTGLYIGISNWGAAENDTQPIQISGAGTQLPAGYSNAQVNFAFDGYTWDSYNPEFTTSIPDPDEPGGYAIDGGYLDFFSVVLSENDYYWNLSNTSTHPIDTNSSVITADKLYPDDKGYWGGESYLDGMLETTSDNNVSLSFTLNPTKQYFLTFFMQTNEDTKFPTWGKFSKATVTPEPISSLLFLVGGGALVTVRRLRKRLTVKRQGC